MPEPAAELASVLALLDDSAASGTRFDERALADALAISAEVEQRLRALLTAATTAHETVAPASDRSGQHALPPTCGWCYSIIQQGASKRCGKCRKRVYCSRDCQLNDWKIGGHRYWCGIAGEMGHDVAVRSIGASKGRGLFALRRFGRGDKILVERLTIRNPRSPEGLSEGVLRAAAALTPHDSTSLVAKFERNCFQADEEGNDGLFITMAYSNHACLPNAIHHTVQSQHSIKLLVASHEIQPGDEICHSYVSLESEVDLAARGLSIQQFLQRKWGFTCTCQACTDPAVRAQLTRMRELDAGLLACATKRQFHAGLQVGTELISLYDAMRYSPKYYARTYYTLFQLAIARHATQAQARRFIKLAHEYRVLLVGEGTECEEVKKFERYLRAPETHPAFLSGDTTVDRADLVRGSGGEWALKVD